MTGCVLLLGRLSNRQTALEAKIETIAQHWHSPAAGTQLRDRQLSLRKGLRQLQQRHRVVRSSVLAVYYALWLAFASLFLLALRTLLPIDGLISASLVLFVLSLVLLLFSVSLTLLDLHTGARSLTTAMLEDWLAEPTNHFTSPDLALQNSLPTESSNRRARSRRQAPIPPLRANVS
jgi:hypothetical protein